MGLLDLMGLNPMWNWFRALKQSFLMRSFVFNELEFSTPISFHICHLEMSLHDFCVILLAYKSCDVNL